MSDILALTQLHSRWLQRATQCHVHVVTNDNNSTMILTTLQSSINCFYQVLCDGQLIVSVICQLIKADSILLNSQPMGSDTQLAFLEDFSLGKCPGNFLGGCHGNVRGHCSGDIFQGLILHL